MSEQKTKPRIITFDKQINTNIYTSESPEAISKELIIIKNEPSSSRASSLLNGVSSSDITALGSLLTVIISLIVAFATIKKYSKDSEHQSRLLERDRKSSKIAKAKEKIEKFYGPLNSLLEESRVIYSFFALEEKNKLKNEGTAFRTLRFLTDNPENKLRGIKRFKKNDQELFIHILDISEKIINLIEAQSGFVENPALHILLGNLAAHYRIIQTASQGKLHGQSASLEKIVFPLEVNGAIYSEVAKLLKIIGDKEDESSPISKNKNIEYYNNNSARYFETTFSIDMSEIYNKVRVHVPYGGSVLDAGCGVGRDTKYFIQKGFKVSSFDASEKMVELCNQYPFAYCEHKCFSTIDYTATFDLVWACASLLHLDKDEFENAVSRLIKAISPNGHFYFSLKKQIDDKKISERKFYCYPFEYLQNLLLVTHRLTLVETWESNSSLTSNETFSNYLYKKNN